MPEMVDRDAARIAALIRTDGFLVDWYRGGPPFEPRDFHACAARPCGAGWRSRLVLFTKDPGWGEVQQFVLDLQTGIWHVNLETKRRYLVGRGSVHAVWALRHLRARIRKLEALLKKGGH